MTSPIGTSLPPASTPESGPSGPMRLREGSMSSEGRKRISQRRLSRAKFCAALGSGSSRVEVAVCSPVAAYLVSTAAGVVGEDIRPTSAMTRTFIAPQMGGASSPPHTRTGVQGTDAWRHRSGLDMPPMRSCLPAEEPRPSRPQSLQSHLPSGLWCPFGEPLTAWTTRRSSRSTTTTPSSAYRSARVEAAVPLLELDVVI